jgi:hypothetical protein
MKRTALRLGAMSLAIGCLLILAILAYFGPYGLNAIWRHGVSIWVTVEPGDTGISQSMQLALQDSPPKVTAGPLTWRQLDRGLEVGELPVLAGKDEVDRILVARIDPAHFKFIVRNAPAGDREPADWLRELGAVVVINGSYFATDGTPATPIASSGVISGPQHYDAKHGAFIASASYVGIRDLAQTEWREAFRSADDAMVSYPMLMGDDGLSRSKGDPRWLANRSFVAQDQTNRIILGTTVNAFFSLNRLAEFLHETPLALKLALNLDGGPVACQTIALNEFKRDFCGRWETTVQDGQIKQLNPLVGNRRWGLPIVLAVLPR